MLDWIIFGILIGLFFCQNDSALLLLCLKKKRNLKEAAKYERSSASNKITSKDKNHHVKLFSSFGFFLSSSQNRFPLFVENEFLWQNQGWIFFNCCSHHEIRKSSLSGMTTILSQLLQFFFFLPISKWWKSTWVEKNLFAHEWCTKKTNVLLLQESHLDISSHSRV